MRVLNSSRRALFNAVAELHNVVSYRTFSRQLQGGRLGVGAGSKRVDVCDYCAAFDQETGDLQKAVNKFEEAVTVCDTDFFVDWRRLAPSSAIEASPKYLTALITYVRNRGLHSTRGEVRAAAATILDEMERPVHGWLAVVEGYSAHFQLRDNQWAQYKDHLTNPAPRTLYAHWDMQDHFAPLVTNNRGQGAGLAGHRGSKKKESESGSSSSSSR